MNSSFPNELSKWCEVGAVVATGILHLLFKSLGEKGLFIALASVSWIGYVVWQLRRDRTKWESWGFRNA